MENFRHFEAGPDPFGRKWTVRFKWMQTAISIRHSDTVDVKFVLESEDGERVEKVIAMSHAGLMTLSTESGVPMTDAWCTRLGAMHLKHVIETGEDLEKEFITPSPADLREYNQELKSAGLTQDMPYLPKTPQPVTKP
jgi:hypothetical protein